MAGFSPVGSAPVGAIGGSNNFATAGVAIFFGSNAIANQGFPNAGKLTFFGGMAVQFTAQPRVTWMGAEILHTGLSSARESWMGVEVLRSVSSVSTLYVLTWIGVEVLHTGPAPPARTSWIGVEVLRSVDAQPPWRTSWMGVEVLRSVAHVQLDSGWVCLLAA